MMSMIEENIVDSQIILPDVDIRDFLNASCGTEVVSCGIEVESSGVEVEQSIEISQFKIKSLSEVCSNEFDTSI
ncbi:unnamed protein product [Brachionus calyciflorus]|uniref:Uncharacterized protein n=1 Tax=Brachionus calyciflorus TaxID=104777 RepID=A0A813X0H4_9BILA|nr:unnamed protein product [Brachionus calyciflorus]